MTDRRWVGRLPLLPLLPLLLLGLSSCAPTVRLVVPEPFRGEPVVQELREGARSAGYRLKIDWSDSNQIAWADDTPAPAVNRQEAFAAIGAVAREASRGTARVCLVVLDENSAKAEGDSFLSAWDGALERVERLTVAVPVNANRVLAQIDQEGPFDGVVVAAGPWTPDILMGLDEIPEPPPFRGGTFVTETSADAFAALAELDAAVVLDLQSLFDGSSQVGGRLVRY